MSDLGYRYMPHHSQFEKAYDPTKLSETVLMRCLFPMFHQPMKSTEQDDVKNLQKKEEVS
jgi:hypothetical protein